MNNFPLEHLSTSYNEKLKKYRKLLECGKFQRIFFKCSKPYLIVTAIKRALKYIPQFRLTHLFFADRQIKNKKSRGLTNILSH